MTRKKCRRKVWALIDPIAHAIAGAAITDTASLDKLRMLELSAIEAFAKGRATPDDWRALADMLNVCETMARDGIGPEALEPSRIEAEMLADESQPEVQCPADEYAQGIEDPMNALRLALARDEEARREAA